MDWFPTPTLETSLFKYPSDGNQFNLMHWKKHYILWLPIYFNQFQYQKMSKNITLIVFSPYLTKFAMLTKINLKCFSKPHAVFRSLKKSLLNFEKDQYKIVGEDVPWRVQHLRFKLEKCWSSQLIPWYKMRCNATQFYCPLRSLFFNVQRAISLMNI